jgi:hypothetical protein
MKKIILFVLATYSLMANPLPQRIETSIKSIQGNSIQLAENVSTGMSGIIVHDYGNGLSAITHSVITTQNGKASILPYTAILHENIPTVKTEAKINDKVILGNFYSNALLIAPDARSYANITKHFHKTWIHPDAYALQFMREERSAISLDSLRKFAMNNQVGLVLIATKTQLLILDPISKKFLGQQAIDGTSTKAMKPFFSRFEYMDISTFGFSKTTLKDYYKAIQDLKQ